LFTSMQVWKKFRSIRGRTAAGLVACTLIATLVTLYVIFHPSADVGEVSQEGTNASPGTVRSSVIDRPAVDRVVPADAAVNVKTRFGAKGDGMTDDTAAIQAGISSAVGLGNPHSILYFPSGTYIISKPLEWKQSDGTWNTGASLIGQNRDNTILKLQDGAPGFSDKATPKSMIVTASQNAAPDGGGNQAFNNFISDLTLWVGRNNPGANGIEYMANNRGAIRNVIIAAARDSGSVGLSMARKWPGPAMIEDVAVRGFSRGALVDSGGYGITFENFRFSGQRVVGIDNVNNTLSMRRVTSNNSVPAIINSGKITIIESTLLGGSTDNTAIINKRTAFVRRVTSSGYSALIDDHGKISNLPANGEYSSSPGPMTRQLCKLHLIPEVQSCICAPVK
jgi:hypothetical protein